MKKPTPRLGIFFFRWTVPHQRMVLWLLVAEKHGKSSDFSIAGLESKKSKRGQQEPRARPCCVEPLSRWALDLLLFNPGKTWSISKRSLKSCNSIYYSQPYIVHHSSNIHYIHDIHYIHYIVHHGSNSMWCRCQEGWSTNDCPWGSDW